MGLHCFPTLTRVYILRRERLIRGSTEERRQHWIASGGARNTSDRVPPGVETPRRRMSKIARMLSASSIQQMQVESNKNASWMSERFWWPVYIGIIVALRLLAFFLPLSEHSQWTATNVFHGVVRRGLKCDSALQLVCLYGTGHLQPPGRGHTFAHV